VPAYNVAAGHSRWSIRLRVSDAGGSRRSYRNGRVWLCRGRGHPLPQRALRVVGVGDAWLEPSSSARWYGFPPPGVDRSAHRDFRPGRSPASRGSGVAKPMTKPSSRSAGCTVTLVLHVWVSDLLLSHCSKGTRSQGGGPQVCRKVVRACSQPQGMFLHFETRRSGVGECARPSP
jgi:hypothetical protein